MSQCAVSLESSTSRAVRFRTCSDALELQSSLLAHRGPDGAGIWLSPRQDVGLCHRRLAIIDLTAQARQPMRAPNGTVITYNGEIYNYLELRESLRGGWQFRSTSDTECILASHAADDVGGISRFRGMFAFALWDERQTPFHCRARPLRHQAVLLRGGRRHALLRLRDQGAAAVPARRSKPIAEALAEYLTFQYTIGERTLFKGVNQLLPGHALSVENGEVKIARYWDVRYDVDFDHSPSYFERRLRDLLDDSLNVFTCAPTFRSGPMFPAASTSSLVAILAAKLDRQNRLTFHGRFTEYPGYDEVRICRAGGAQRPAHRSTSDRHHGGGLSRPHPRRDLAPRLSRSPVRARSRNTWCRSSRAEHVKVVLGGQGGDEVFGGYARYLVAYFEQCIKAAIDGTYQERPLRRHDRIDRSQSRTAARIQAADRRVLARRACSAISTRATSGSSTARATWLDEVDWSPLDKDRVFEAFRAIFNNRKNVRKEAYFDKMTHFDFKCLLPALLQVEDRMSMAHGLESRVPLLDHPLVEFAATAPADVKFEGGNMKHLLKRALGHELPETHSQPPRQDGLSGAAEGVVRRRASRLRPGSFPIAGRPDAVRSSTERPCLPNFDKAGRFSRKTWGLMSLEIWHQLFHDRAAEIRWRPSQVAQPDVRLAEVVHSGSRAMKVFITGGSGQVGSHVAELLLARGDHVLAIDNFATGRRDNLDPHPNLDVSRRFDCRRPL